MSGDDYAPSSARFSSPNDRSRPVSGRRTPAGSSGGYGEVKDNNEISNRRLDEIPDSDLIDYEDEGEGESLMDEGGQKPMLMCCF